MVFDSIATGEDKRKKNNWWKWKFSFSSVASGSIIAKSRKNFVECFSDSIYKVNHISAAKQKNSKKIP